MAERMENKESQKYDLQSAIEKTAEKRAGFTRGFLEKINKPIADFVEELKKKPFEITIDPKDDKSLALGIFQLQKKLGFSEEDNAQGCDGKFGPFTKRAYEGNSVANKSAGARAAMSEDIAPEVASTVPVAPAEPAGKEEVRSNNEKFDTTKISETVFVGDSLTEGMAGANGIKGCVKFYKGGSSTHSYTRERRGKYGMMNLANFLNENKSAIEQKQIKKVVVALGTNDITNFRGNLDTVDAIIGRLKSIFGQVTAAGLSLVACTIPYSELPKRIEYWQRIHKGKYPYSLSDLEQRVDKVNDFIRSQAGGNVKVVDLYNDTKNQAVYPLSSDGLHFTGRGAKKMAERIRAEGDIKDA